MKAFYRRLTISSLFFLISGLKAFSAACGTKKSCLPAFLPGRQPFFSFCCFILRRAAARKSFAFPRCPAFAG